MYDHLKLLGATGGGGGDREGKGEGSFLVIIQAAFPGD